MKNLFYIFSFVLFANLQAQPFQDFKILENPVYETCNLQFKVTESAPITLRVFAITGSVMHEAFNNQILDPSTYIVSIQTISWPNSVYFVVIESGDYKKAMKIIKHTAAPLSTENFQQDFKIYFNSQLSTLHLSENDKLLHAYLIDMQGRVLLQNPQFSNAWQLDNIPSGVYVATFVDNGKVVAHYKFSK